MNFPLKIAQVVPSLNMELFPNCKHRYGDKKPGYTIKYTDDICSRRQFLRWLRHPLCTIQPYRMGVVYEGASLPWLTDDADTNITHRVPHPPNHPIPGPVRVLDTPVQLCIVPCSHKTILLKKCLNKHSL